MSVLKTVDMVVSISQETINYQFSVLRKQNIIQENWNLALLGGNELWVTPNPTNFMTVVGSDKFAFAFNAQIGDPKISIVKDQPQTVLFLIPIKSGTVHYWTSVTGSREVVGRQLRTADMKDWCFAFKVKLGSMEKSIAGFPGLNSLDQKYFTIENLLMDLQNSHYAEYDESSTSFSRDQPMPYDFRGNLDSCFKAFIKAKSPYLLGYELAVKDIPGQQEAMFQPTALKYSSTYNDKPGLSALNYLAMTEKKPFPADPNLGVFSKSLITDSNGDGELTLSAELFCKKMFDAIGFEKIHTDCFDKIKKQKTAISTPNKKGISMDVYDPATYDGIFSRAEYGLNAISLPYVYTLEGQENSPSNSNYYRQQSSVLPFINFFSSNFVIKSQLTNRFVVQRKFGAFSTTEGAYYTINVPAFSSQLKYPLGLGVGTHISIQSTEYLSKKQSNNGYFVTYYPEFTFFNVEAGAGGKLMFKSGHTAPEAISQKLPGPDVDVNKSFTSFETVIKNSVSDSSNKILDVMKNDNFGAKIIFPFNRIYAYKGLRFESDPEGTKIPDNTIRVKVSYEPVVN